MTLARTFGCVRVVYNLLLALRSTAWAERQERQGYHATSAELIGTGQFTEVHDHDKKHRSEAFAAIHETMEALSCHRHKSFWLHLDNV